MSCQYCKDFIAEQKLHSKNELSEMLSKIDEGLKQRILTAIDPILSNKSDFDNYFKCPKCGKFFWLFFEGEHHFLSMNRLGCWMVRDPNGFKYKKLFYFLISILLIVPSFLFLCFLIKLVPSAMVDFHAFIICSMVSLILWLFSIKLFFKYYRPIPQRHWDDNIP